MSMQFFSFGRRNDLTIVLPTAYRQSVSWIPRIGDVFPAFVANSTEGPMKFSDWAQGSWVYLFSHPAAFTPVCTTEMGEVAAAMPMFSQRGVKVLSVSRSTLDEQSNWTRDIKAVFGVDVGFPQVSDAGGVIAKACGMIHPKESAEVTVRKSFILGPDMRIRMIFEYPIRVGRNVDEILRTVDALQTIDTMDVATPGGWQYGDDVLLMPDVTPKQANQRFGSRWRQFLSYLRTAPMDVPPP